MLISSRFPRTFLLFALVIGTLAGLIAAKYRLHVENANRRVEMGLEWDEVSRLAQFSHVPVADLLARFKQVDVTSLVIQEDTFTTLEQAGAVHPTIQQLAPGRSVTYLSQLNTQLFKRIETELKARGIPVASGSAADNGAPATVFMSVPQDYVDGHFSADFTVPIDYSNLRTIGLGLPPDALAAAAAANMQVAGRISNFPGVNAASARAVLDEIAAQGVSIVIINGDEVLGYREFEPQVAEMLKDGVIAVKSSNGNPAFLAYGAIEFGKQKGDEKLAAKLNGDLIRVHSIQAGEMGQLDREDAIDRFSKAARERNIRFCYVRLLTFAGPDPIETNVKFVNSIARAINKGGVLTGGGLQFGAARRFQPVGAPSLLYPLLGIGVAACLIWMLSLVIPLNQPVLFGFSGVLLALLAAAGGETGRKLCALLAGICFPAAACLYTYPVYGIAQAASSLSECMKLGCQTLAVASAITAAGIIHVVGLLTARPYMVHTSQFLGIKAQHAVPFLIVLIVSVIGGCAQPGERLARFQRRAGENLRAAMSEPARFGTLIFGIVVLAALVLIIARTGNDAGVGVSGTELKVRAILDRVMPVRPRTKEFLIGHPAFILGFCWWLRGRRRLAIPAIVIGSLGQVSLLNTFCHIHTPLIVSAWRGGIGLIIGAVIGLAVFALGERLMPPPEQAK